MRDDDVFRKTRERVLALYPVLPPVGLSAEASRARAGRDEVRALASLYEEPFSTLAGRAEYLSVSVPTVSRLLARLEMRKWAYPLNFSLRGRGFVKYYNLTSDGLRAAQLELPDVGGGSFIHRQCQQHLKRLFAQEGLEPRVEFTLNGKRADLAFRFGGKWTALEVGISNPDGEFSNLTKDYAAGFDEVRLLVRESGMMHRVQALMTQNKYKAPRSLKLELLTDYLRRSTVPMTND